MWLVIEQISDSGNLEILQIYNKKSLQRKSIL